MKPKGSWKKTLVVWIILIAVVAGSLVGGSCLFRSCPSAPSEVEEYRYSEIMNMVKQNKIKSVEIRGEEISGRTRDGKVFRTPILAKSQLAENLENSSAEITIRPETNYLKWLFIIIPTILIFSVVVVPLILAKKAMGSLDTFFEAQRETTKDQQGIAKSQMDLHNSQQKFTKSKAKRMGEDSRKVTFADVAGMDEVVDEFREIVYYLQDAREDGLCEVLKAKMPRGVILSGLPGTGKTLLAKAIAGEAGVPFLYLSGSDFVEMYVGVGAARVRDLFEEAKKIMPCIVFIDEVDAVGGQRGTSLNGERDQTLNQILVELDGMEENDNIVVIIATNRPDLLDSALTRSRRIDRRIATLQPDRQGREEILYVHIKDRPLGDDVDISEIAKSTSGFVGADLEALVDEAALLAVRDLKKGVRKERVIVRDNFREAKNRVLMGAERRTLSLSEEEMGLVTAHELGHAAIATVLEHAYPVETVTNVPRLITLGMTWLLSGDRYIKTEEHALAEIKCALGGRAAEEIIFGTRASGAANDIKRATEIAEDMIAEWGMSKIGPINLKRGGDNPLLGRQLPMPGQVHGGVAEEIKTLITKAYEEARQIIERNKDAMEVLQKMLLEERTLDGSEVVRVFEEHGVDKPNSL